MMMMRKRREDGYKVASKTDVCNKLTNSPKNRNPLPSALYRNCMRQLETQLYT